LGEPFALSNTYPRGTLLLRKYRDVKDQGHVAVVLDGALGEESPVLQSFAKGGYPETQPGVNADFTVKESHDGGYYEHAVLPSQWLSLERGK
jgi:hypothetical protein